MLNVGIIGCAGHYGLALDSADEFETCNIAAVAAPNDGTDDTSLKIVAGKGIYRFTATGGRCWKRRDRT